MDVNVPCEFIGCGAMDDNFAREFIGFGAMDIYFPYEIIGFGAMDGRFPFEFMELMRPLFEVDCPTTGILEGIPCPRLVFLD